MPIQIHPTSVRQTERGRTFAHSSDTANMRLRATAPHVLQRCPADTNAPTKSIHAGKKTSFQRRDPMMAVRHINHSVPDSPKAAGRGYGQDGNPVGDEPLGTLPRTEPSQQNALKRRPNDPSGPVFSSPCHQNRQTAHRHSLQTLSSSWMSKPAPTAAHQPLALGGACRDRTDDPLLAKQMLSQLS